MARTFSAGCTTAWAAVVDGAQYSSAGIQLAGQTTVLVATATAEPAANFADYMKLELGSARELVIDLDANEKLYIKAAVNLVAAISGYRKVRA